MGGYDIWRQGAAQAQCVPHARPPDGTLSATYAAPCAKHKQPWERCSRQRSTRPSEHASIPPGSVPCPDARVPCPARWPLGAPVRRPPRPAGWLGRLEPSSQQGLVLMAVRPTLSRGADLIPPSGATALRLVPGAYAASSAPGTDQSRVRASFVASARGAPPHPHPTDPAVITRCAYAISPPAAPA